MKDFTKLVRDMIEKYHDAYLTRRIHTIGKESLPFEEFIKREPKFKSLLSEKAMEQGITPYALIHKHLTEGQIIISGSIFKEQTALSEQKFKESLDAGTYDFVFSYAKEHGTIGDLADIAYALHQSSMHEISDIHHIYASLRGYLGSSRHHGGGNIDLEKVLQQLPQEVFKGSSSLENIFYTIEVRRYFEDLIKTVQNKELKKNPQEYNKRIDKNLHDIVQDLDKKIRKTDVKNAKWIFSRVKNHYQELRDFSLEGVVTELNGKVFPNLYQRIGIKFIYDDKRVLIADEMGTGKTAQAILGSLYAQQKSKKPVKALIVVPNSVKQTMKAELFKYVPDLKEDDIVVINGGNRAESLERAKNARFVIINYELIHRTEWKKDDLEETEVTAEIINNVTNEIEQVHIKARQQKPQLKALAVAQRILRKESRGKLKGIEAQTLDDAIETIAKVRKLEEDTAIIKKLQNIGFNYVVLDEVHNAKNLERYTTKAVRNIAKNTEYLVLLSGTPVPNGMQDLEVPFELLGFYDPERMKEKIRQLNNYPADKKIQVRFADIYEQDPRWIRDVIRRGMLRRKSDQVLDLPKLTVEDHEISLDYNHRRIYQAILDNTELSPTNKIIALRKCLLDPELLLRDNDAAKALAHRPELIDLINKGVSSSKYRELETDLAKNVNGDKAIIFTSLFKQGVTTVLEERLKKQYCALRIDGDVTDDIKEWKTKNGWRKDLDDFCETHGVDKQRVQCIINEAKGSISEREIIRKLFMKHPEYKILIATTRTMREGISLTAANRVYFIDKPYTYAEFEQTYKRAHREGQVKPVTVKSFVAKDSLDIGINRLLSEKRRLGDLIIDGAPLTAEEKELINQSTQVPAPITEFMRPQDSILLKLYGALHGAGEEKAKYLLNTDKLISELYADNYIDNPYAIHTAELVKAIIQKTDAQPERILDLAAGYGLTSNALGKPTTNLDVNPNMLNRAKQLNPNSKNVVGTMQHMPFNENSFDTVVCSLAFHYASPEERPQILHQINNVLEKYGRLILTLPKSRIDVEGANKLEAILEKQGFKTNPQATGFVKNQLDNYDVYVYVGNKVRDAETVTEPLRLTDTIIESVPVEYQKRTAKQNENEINTDFTFYGPKAGKKRWKLVYSNNQDGIDNWNTVKVSKRAAGNK